MPSFRTSLLTRLHSVARGCALLAPLATGCAMLSAQQPVLAPTPPMGWNSWDSYGLTITQDQFEANVAVEAHVLKPSGYRYAVVDEGWYLANPDAASKPESLNYRMDPNGRYLPAVNRFPSAGGEAGFSPLAAFVHAQGLKFGIHIIRGISKKAVAANLSVAESGFHAADLADTTDSCPWNPDNYGVKDNAAGQAWYDALMAQYAGWGVDYLKVDCIASHPYKAAEIRMIHRAILKTHRPIVLSLSPGAAPLERAAELAANAQLWRISNDVWDLWKRDADPDGFPQSVTRQFAVIASWNKYVQPGTWPDADMLPLGILGPKPGWGEPRASRLTHDEQQSLMTLWAISRSPLFFGGNLTQLDDGTRLLLTNPDLTRIDQAALSSRQVNTANDLVTWSADLPGGQRALALFNRGDAAMIWSEGFADVALSGRSYRVKDVWSGHEYGRVSKLEEQRIPPHGSVLLLLTP